MPVHWPIQKPFLCPTQNSPAADVRTATACKVEQAPSVAAPTFSHCLSTWYNGMPTECLTSVLLLCTEPSTLCLGSVFIMLDHTVEVVLIGALWVLLAMSHEQWSADIVPNSSKRFRQATVCMRLSQKCRTWLCALATRWGCISCPRCGCRELQMLHDWLSKQFRETEGSRRNWLT